MNQVKAGRYTWEQVEFGGKKGKLLKILALIAGKQVTGEVEVLEIDYAVNTYSSLIFGTYGTRDGEVHGAVSFDDGSVLVCLTTNTWRGSLASHDKVEVRYYTLTPLYIGHRFTPRSREKERCREANCYWPKTSHPDEQELQQILAKVHDFLDRGPPE